MSKRGNNEGSAYYQESRKRWAGAVNLGGGKRKVVYGKTRAEVAKQLAAALRQHDQGMPCTPDKLTVAQYLTEWIESVQPRLKPSTHQTYRHYMNAHIIPALGKHALTKLKPDHVQAFLNERHASGLAPRTVQQMHAILRSALIAHSSGKRSLVTSRPSWTSHERPDPACAR